MVYNPSLRQESRNQRASVIPLQNEASILDWLEASGRLLARDQADFDYDLGDEEEINELMENDGGSFDIDDDDDDLDLED